MKNATITLGDNKTVVKEIQLSPTSYPTNYLNFKINIASSENANNALIQKRYDRYLPYTTLASLMDDRKKNSMEFFNCVVFIQETGDVSTHREFDNCDIQFYGIGNIGDSKKTDDSRVNDANDPNEFCVEIMDWNRELSSFPSNTIVNAMKYTTDPDTNEKEYAWAKDENLDILYELIDGEYVLTKDTTVDLSKTYYVDALENDDFSEDFTYGFRYLWEDGTDEENAEAFNNCKQKWIDFYRFITRDLTTNGKEDSNKVNAWKSEFSNWFIFDAALYYYLYTLRYTMVDNRAKNSFYHWGKHYITFEEAIEKGIAVYDEDKNLITDASNLPSVFYDVNGREIKNINAKEAAINDGYRMEFWMYDNDTALGIDNAGKLEIPYGVEDNDVDSAGVPYFRANDSLVFTRIAKYFTSELENAWHNTEINPVGKAFDSVNFINEFDTWQGEFPEELWRLDYERKYKRTYVGGTGEEWYGALPQSNKSDITSTRFLTEMMNGRKKYQRRCFERNQEIYMSSKFKGEVNLTDTITLRGTGRPTNKAVEPNFALTITPFSKMYVNLYNSTSEIYYHKKCEAGVTITPPIEYPNTNLDFIYIRGASQIQSLGDLSPMYLQTAELTPGAKLKTITLGNATDGYSNDSLRTLQIGAGNKLLEELDIRNLSNLSNTVLPVVNIPSLKRVYAQGSNITEARFANNGLLEEAYLPETITRLELRNLHYLKTINLESYNNLLYLTVMNCSDMMNNLVLDMINQAPDLRELRVTNVNWNFDDTSVLERLYGLIKTPSSPEVVLTGTVHVPVIGKYELEKYNNVWPDLTVVGEDKPQFKVTFVNHDGTVLDTQYIYIYDSAVDPRDKGIIPTKDSEVAYDYEFAKWDKSFTNVQEDKIITAIYTATIRKYSIQYVSNVRNNKTIHKTYTDIPYGDSVVYDGEIPTYTLAEPYTYYMFNGWDKSGIVDGDFDENGVKTVTAVFDEFTSAEGFDGKKLEDLSPVEVYALIDLSKRGSVNIGSNYGQSSESYSGFIADGDKYSFSLGRDFKYKDVPSVEIIGENSEFGDEYKSTVEFVRNNDGTGTYFDTGIQLFDEDKDFVLAIDYEFTGSAANSVLAQCCQVRNNLGFKLLYNNGAQLKWGNVSGSKIANANEREMLVIRHKKGETNLTVYSSNLGEMDIAYETLNSDDFISTSTLVFGCEKQSSTVFANYASGKIHWAKLWYKDLGDSVCKELVLWTHENVELQACGFNKYYIANSVDDEQCSFSLIATHLLDRTRRWNPGASGGKTGTGNTGGWQYSELNEYMNNRVYKAMPDQIKLLLKEVEVYSSIGNASYDTSSSYCYITAPAIIELDSSKNSSPFDSEGSHISYIDSLNTRKRTFRDGSECENGYWTRSPHIYTGNPAAYVYYIDKSGNPQPIGAVTTNRGMLIEISF